MWKFICHPQNRWQWNHNPLPQAQPWHYRASSYRDCCWKFSVNLEASRLWSKFNNTVKEELTTVLAKGGKVRILTGSIISPSTKKMVAEFVAANPNADIKIWRNFSEFFIVLDQFGLVDHALVSCRSVMVNDLVVQDGEQPGFGVAFTFEFCQILMSW